MQPVTAMPWVYTIVTITPMQAPVPGYCVEQLHKHHSRNRHQLWLVCLLFKQCGLLSQLGKYHFRSDLQSDPCTSTIPPATHRSDLWEQYLFSTAGGYAAYFGTTATVDNTDYNDFYSNGAYLTYWNGNMATLSAHQTASSSDAHSISVDPGFVSATDLHATNFDLNAAATPIPRWCMISTVK